MPYVFPKIRITQAHYEDAEVNLIGLSRFNEAMAEKLMKCSRVKDRKGWHIPSEVTVAQLRQMLAHHVAKGDPVDIANFAMMIWNRQNPTGRKLK